MLLDSNIIIYSAKPEHADLRKFIGENAAAVSAASMVEVLGYHRLGEAEKKHFEEFFAAAVVLPISAEIVTQAIELRQFRKMSLGDSLIAATALVHGRTLVTCNTRDFEWIAGLSLLNPLSGSAKSS